MLQKKSKNMLGNICLWHKNKDHFTFYMEITVHLYKAEKT